MIVNLVKSLTHFCPKVSCNPPIDHVAKPPFDLHFLMSEDRHIHVYEDGGVIRVPSHIVL
ncbi:hypothetical protein VCRA2111O136_170062 [Vibrio crassostreae]|nr:hypothetical protein VCRA2111O136_170062 [Vibrio crassostreae]CAK2947840.1 hypothetical protein VCRA217O134_300036 [Vibrio crassostreae]